MSILITAAIIATLIGTTVYFHTRLSALEAKVELWFKAVFADAKADVAKVETTVKSKL
jgi:hypothetical protein